MPTALRAAPASTGDPVLDRLNALEARIRQLEARNAELEQQAELNEGRLQTVETRAAKAAQFSWAPDHLRPDRQLHLQAARRDRGRRRRLRRAQGRLRL